MNLTAVMPTSEQMELLHIEDEPLLKNSAVMYYDNIPYEYVETYYVGSKFSYYADFSSSS